MAKKLSYAQRQRLELNKQFYKRANNARTAMNMAIDRERMLRQSALHDEDYLAARKRLLSSTRPGPRRQVLLADLKARRTAPYDHRIKQYRARRLISLERIRQDRREAQRGLTLGLRKQKRARKLVKQRHGILFKPRKLAPSKLAKRGGYTPTPASFKKRVLTRKQQGHRAFQQSFPTTRAGYDAYYLMMTEALATRNAPPGQRIQGWSYQVESAGVSVAIDMSRDIEDTSLWLTFDKWMSYAQIKVDVLGSLESRDNQIANTYFSEKKETGLTLIKALRKAASLYKRSPSVKILVRFSIGDA